MKYNRQITISVGNSRKDMDWRQKSLTVEELYARLKTPVRGAESYTEYMAMKKAQQDALKDVGGFVGGALSGSRRKNTNVLGRDIVTLDFDNIPGWHTEIIEGKIEELGCSYCIYSTRKHSSAAPRLRVIVPMDRTVSPDEYEPCARRIAAHIGISMADPTTFEVARLMYWPSCSADSEFFYQSKDAPLMSADYLLSTYADWHDLTSWPQVPGATSYQKLAVKQGDPSEKPGIVGAFCRTYDIYTAMDTFLPRIYEAVSDSGERYTYSGGSTTGGAIVYDNGKFLFSHHATDPCGGRLVNAFDLVRLHKFGDSDADSAPDTPVSKLPSYLSMCEFAVADERVRATLNRERAQQAAADFEGVGLDNSDDPASWAAALDLNEKGAVRNTIDNVLIILEGDPQLKGRFALNQFAGRGEVLDSLPWNDSKSHRLWSDTDSNGLYWYMEKYYGLKGRGNIDSALDIHASTHAFNDVQSFINGLVWDGQARLDTLFIDYLGAEDTEYNRAVCRKAFTAAIARAMQPGCKFDNMLILSGPQGIGKSTLLDRMSKGWFNDSIRTFEGKDASELLQGVWLVEISELDAFRRTDVSRIKQFLSLRADRYRAAYGRHVKELPRCCVFFGTTNTTDFLQDMTGNRRFWPVDVGEVDDHSKHVWEDLTDAEVNQIWAEAKTRWQLGEPLYLWGDVETAARDKQEEHRETSIQEGLILEFAERKIPTDWQNWSIDRRRDFWAGQMHAQGDIQLVERTTITVAEVWCELFNGAPRDCNQPDSRKISSVLANMPGWKRAEKTFRAGPYNVQRGYYKVL